MAFRSYLTVVILFFINLLNYMDRFTVAGVLTSIEHYYGLNHSQSGLLQTSFIVSYMIFAPIFGYLGDRYQRKLIMTFGILFWSLTTFLGSLIPASHPILFFLMRALVGVGEASYSTIAPTIIADLFETSMRSKMLAFFYFAIPVGSGLGYIVGTSVASLMGEWHWALRVTPPLGVICVILLVFLVREPKRGESDGAQNNREKTVLKDDIKNILRVRSFVWSTLGFTCVTFSVGALSWWAPTYMKYAYIVSNNEKTEDWIGLIFGIIACIGGIVGVVIGVSGSQFYRLYNPRADPLVCAIGVLVAVPSTFLCLVLAHNWTTFSWLLIFIAVTAMSTNWSIVADMTLYVITPNQRSMAQAIQILTSHLFGDASSPFIIGFVSDQLVKGNTNTEKYWSLQYSLYITPFVLVFGVFAFFYTSSFIVADKEQCKSLTQGQRSRNSSDTSIHTLPPSATNIINEVGVEDTEGNNTFVDSDNKFLLYS